MSVLVCGLTLSFLWGLLPAVHKAVLNNNTHHHVVMVISGLAYFFALLVFIIMNNKLLITEGKKIKPSVVIYLAVATICCTFTGSLIYYYALSNYDSHIVTAIAYSCPVFTLIFAYLFLKEDIHILGFIGVLLIVSGVVCIGLNEIKYGR